MSGEVWLHGEALRPLGFLVGAMPRFAEAPIRTLPGLPIPGRAGGIHLGDGLIERRELVIEGTFVRDSAALREAAEEALKGVLSIGLIEIRVRDARGVVRVAHGVPVNRAPLGPIGPLFVSRGSRWTLSFACAEATWRTEEPVIVALGPTARAVTLGTAPSDLIVRAFGAGTGVTLDCRTAGGVLTTQMTLGNIAADECLEVDGGAETVTEYDSGVVTNALGVIGDDPFPAYGLTPADGEGQTVALPAAASGDLWYWPRSA